ncbi:hypothetical protein [Burkholderia vietnamiensis]|uniref:hypothetical protein n=1 Tax=Burkholderia vietnamiensis TaxID=60552 RepID=UPI00352F9E62
MPKRIDIKSDSHFHPGVSLKQSGRSMGARTCRTAPGNASAAFWPRRRTVNREKFGRAEAIDSSDFTLTKTIARRLTFPPWQASC